MTHRKGLVSSTHQARSAIRQQASSEPRGPYLGCRRPGAGQPLRCALACSAVTTVARARPAHEPAERDGHLEVCADVDRGEPLGSFEDGADASAARATTWVR